MKLLFHAALCIWISGIYDVTRGQVGETCCRYNCKTGAKLCQATLRKVGPVNTNGRQFYTRLHRVTDGIKDLSVEPQYSLEYLEDKAEGILNETLDEVALDFTTISSCAEATFARAKIWNGTGGVFDMKIGREKREVYCDTTTDGGNWTVFQRRIDGSENFHRVWDDYVQGFGNASGEYWLGLEALHQLTSSGDFELRVDLEDWNGTTGYAVYRNFAIGNSTELYRLSVVHYDNGTAPDSLTFHRRMSFSTLDADHDRMDEGNCAQERGGGWWFRNCLKANLNGRYFNTETVGVRGGIEWREWKGIWVYSFKSAEMKFRQQNE